MSSADASLTAKIDGEPAQIKQSGLYFVALSNCDTKDEGFTKLLSGELEAKSAYGYLPGELSMLLYYVQFKFSPCWQRGHTLYIVLDM